MTFKKLFIQVECREIVILNSYFGCLYPKKSLAQRGASPDILSDTQMSGF